MLTKILSQITKVDLDYNHQDFLSIGTSKLKMDKEFSLDSFFIYKHHIEDCPD